MNSEKKITAKEQAVKDIKDDLKKEGRVFMHFRQELNQPIRKLVNEQLKEQRNVSYNFTFFSKKIK